MREAYVDPMFWKDKKVFLTGHTGFKGSWLSLWLVSMGARVTGYALAPITKPNLFEILGINSLIEKSHIADIRDLENLKNAIKNAKPDIVIHMAAQPLVRYSYVNPVETYATNVMGTVHLLESMRLINTVRATVIVTTDKCYENQEWIWGYRESEPMGGFDPYSNSKGCAELVTSAYRQSYFSDANSINSVASARAGNVIGGGDWSADRLIPDAIKAFEINIPVQIRNPLAVRPWQHVLDPLSGYLILAQALYGKQGGEFASGWNFGPEEINTKTVEWVISEMAKNWGGDAAWMLDEKLQPHEAHLLKLDISKAKNILRWRPKIDISKCLKLTIDWEKSRLNQQNMHKITLDQIQAYMGLID